MTDEELKDLEARAEGWRAYFADEAERDPLDLNDGDPRCASEIVLRDLLAALATLRERATDAENVVAACNIALSAMRLERDEYADHVDRWMAAHDELGLKLEAADALAALREERDSAKADCEEACDLAQRNAKECDEAMIRATRAVAERDEAILRMSDYAYKFGELKGRYEALIEEAKTGFTDVRAAIMEHAPDTLWVGLIETAVDRIDSTLAKLEAAP